MNSKSSAAFLKLHNIHIRKLKDKQIKKQKSHKLRFMIIECIELQININAAITSMLQHQKRGKLWVLPELVPPKPDGYWEMVGTHLDDYRFQKKYRVNKKTFEYICNIVCNDLYRSNTIMRPSTSVEKRVIIALHILKSTCDIGTVADFYKVGKSSVGHILNEFCESLIKHLYATQISFPITENERDYISSQFLKKCRFPNTFGALDGTHIPIKKPTSSSADYFNYKHYYSINVLALVDDNYCFRYINVGRPGGVHDAAVLRDDKLSAFLEKSTTKHHIIADGAFPLKNYLLKPFPGTHLTPAQEYFNFRLSSARMRVENAFGRLKGRMRILSKRIDFSLKHTKQIIKTCLIIHNLGEKNNCTFHQNWQLKAKANALAFPEVPQRVIRDGGNTDGQMKRNELTAKLYIEQCNT